MKVIFSIEYRTRWGEDLRVCVSDGHDDLYVIPLQTKDGVRWRGEFYTNDLSRRITYFYSVFYHGMKTRQEFSWRPRVLKTDSPTDVFVANDAWRDLPSDFPFYSSAFSSFEVPCAPILQEPMRSVLQLKVNFPHNIGRLAVVGNLDYLGNWNPSAAIPLTLDNFSEWYVNLDASQLSFPFEYKFVLQSPDGKVFWEQNPNRVVPDCGLSEGMTFSLSDQFVDFGLPKERYAGVSIPLFALKSASSCGIGDFSDLCKMVDWAVNTGMKFVQILPINDTTATKTWHDSYPYSAVSVFALNPIYIDVVRAGRLDDELLMSQFEQCRSDLNALPQVDYEAVLSFKLDYMHRLFEQDYDAVVANPSFVAYCRDNASWLRPYAAFCTLRDKFKTPDFMQWGEYSAYHDSVYEELMSSDRHTVTFYAYLQWVAGSQMSDASAYARAHGVVIKGDIPIGVSRCSADVWVEPALFNLDGQAGAPPDAFAADGQNWGFPTYNWNLMAEDGYSWWCKRFEVMARYFDAYRIDHILGFFRIWEIPVDAVSGIMGHFTPALPLSADELRSRGFDFDPALHSVPYITDAVLMSVFGHKAGIIRETYLDEASMHGKYTLRESVSTAAKVMRLDGVEIEVKRGLLKLLSNVLFIEDTRSPGMYHPRIAVQDAPVYDLLLDDDEKRTFDAIYEDFYYVRHNDFWRESAMRKLPPLIMSSPMLACAEDLGMIPACVPDVLDALHILSLEVQRMPKIYGREFGEPADYPYYSVCTTSTHDTSTLRGWWQEDAVRTGRYYNNYLHFWGEAPRNATTDICRIIVAKHLESPSMLCILPYQDWMSISELRSRNVAAERINDPADGNHYWRYRMNMTLDDLLAASSLNDEIRGMISASGRISH